MDDSTTGQPRDPARLRRLFFAVWPDGAARRALEARRRQLLPAPADRTVRVEDLHITLLFLGAVPEARLPALRAGAAALRGRPLMLRFDALEYWQGGRVCALVAAPSATAQALHRQLRALAQGLGLAVERRPLVPHVTLARNLRRRPARALSGSLAPLRIRAAQFCLAESLAAPRGGSRYIVRDRWPLG